MTDLAVTPEEDEAFAQLDRRYQEQMQENATLADSLYSEQQRAEQLEAHNRYLEMRLRRAESNGHARIRAEGKAEAAATILEWSQGLLEAESVRSHARNVMRRARQEIMNLESGDVE